MNTMLIEDAGEQMLIQWTHDSTSLGEDFVPKDWDENLSHQPDEKDWMKYRWQVEDDYLPGHHNMVEPPTYFDDWFLWSHNRIELDGLTTTAGHVLDEALLEDKGKWGMAHHQHALQSDVEGCASPAFKNPEHRDHDHWKKCEARRQERKRERIQNG
jgi:hypothetical protein